LIKLAALRQEAAPDSHRLSCQAQSIRHIPNIGRNGSPSSFFSMIWEKREISFSNIFFVF